MSGMINRTEDQIKIQGLEAELDKCHLKVARLEAVAKLLKKGGKRKTRRRKQRGGEVSLEFEKPQVSNTSAGGAIQGAMHNQKESNAEITKLNKEFGQNGGSVVVPQMSQAGDNGNKTITGGVQNTLQGRADSEFDKDVHNKPVPDGMPGGGRRRRRKRKTKRKTKRKSKKRRRRKRKTKRKRKSRRKR
tara:strand:+ start:30 stop:596 length:567 start_codon:yes stop_codon:yes gene_type:complete